MHCYTILTIAGIAAASGPAVVSQIADGQVQNPVPVQPTAQTTSYSNTTQSTPGTTVTHISDGQAQVPGTAKFITQKPSSVSSTVPSTPLVTQIPDGQIQAPTGGNTTIRPTQPISYKPAYTNSTKATTPKGSQVSSGPVRVTGIAITPPAITSTRTSSYTSYCDEIETWLTATPSPTSKKASIASSSKGSATTSGDLVTQISDGQVQAPTSSGSTTSAKALASTKAQTSSASTATASAAVVTQIGDGQVQVPTGATASAPSVAPTPSTPATGDAAAKTWEFIAAIPLIIGGFFL